MKDYTLAIETSCDDTSISILNGKNVISLKVLSQIKDHKKYGGVIPEVASRLHSQNIFSVFQNVIEETNLEMKDIKRIAVTSGPGLVNTLQVGITVAKSLSYILDVPLYEVDHIEAHAYSPFIGNGINNIPSKAIVLIASGGHTQLFIKKDWSFKLLGETRDDAIGEAYDKVSKILGYGYPGGPVIDKIFKEGNEQILPFPIVNLENYDFSYSGLKSFALNKFKEKKNKKSIASGFQVAAIEQLILKINKASKEFGINDIIIGGGVSANSLLRKRLSSNDSLNSFVPKLTYTIDNAAMIGYLANIKIKANKIKPTNFSLDAVSRRNIYE